MTRFLRISIALFSLFVAALVGAVIVWWAPDVPLANLTAKWAKPPSTFISVEGMQVHIRDEGPRNDPVPIVLIHGTSASLHTWDGWVSSLRAKRRVIRFDLPGFGLTGPAPDGDYSLDRYSRFVGATLDVLGVRKAILAGNSLGGQIAWATAVAQPERIVKLVLIDAAGYPFTSESMPIGFRIARMPGINRVMESILPRSLIKSSIRNVYGNPDKVTPELIDRYYELTRREGNRHALGQRFQQMPPGEQAEKISTLRLPTLILWGGRDRLIPPENARRFKQDIAGSKLVIFDDLGHVPHEEDPSRTVQAVLHFLDGSV